MQPPDTRTLSPAVPPSPRRTSPAALQPFPDTPRLPIPSRVPPRATPILTWYPLTPVPCRGGSPSRGNSVPRPLPPARALRRSAVSWGTGGHGPPNVTPQGPPGTSVVTHSPPNVTQGAPAALLAVTPWTSRGSPAPVPCSSSVGTPGWRGAHPGTGLGAVWRGLELSPVCRCAAG